MFNPAGYNNDVGVDDVVPVVLGGTGAITAVAASDNLNLLRLNTINIANGIVGLDANSKIALSLFKTGANGLALLDATGKLPLTSLPDTVVNSGVTIEGPTTTTRGQATSYTLTTYDSFTTYTITATNGNVVRNGEVITYTPAANGAGGFTVNGKAFAVTVIAASIATPSILTPINGATGVSMKPEFISSAFQFHGDIQTQDQVRWEISATPDFATLTQYYEGTANFTNWLPSAYLAENNQYYARVRHHSAIYGWSAWSATVAFTTYEFQGWVANADSASTDCFTKVAVSPDGNAIYAVGYQSSQTADQPDAYITRWDINGVLVWQRSLDGSSTSYFEDIVISSDGVAIYAVGRQYSQTAGSCDAYITRWNTDGSLVWQRAIGGTGDDRFYGVDISPDNTAIYAVGYQSSQTLGYGAAFTTRWDASGALIWQRSIAYANTANEWRNVAVSPDGAAIYTVGIYPPGGYYIARWGNTGSLIWSRTASGNTSRFYDVAISPDGAAIYAVGHVNRLGGSDINGYVTKWDTSGTRAWQRSIGHSNGNDYLWGVAISPDGAAIYIVGQYDPQTYNKTYVTCWDSTGDSLWDYNYNLGDIADDEENSFTGVAASPNGIAVYAVGDQGTQADGVSGALISCIPSSGDIALGALTGINMTGLSWDTGGGSGSTPTESSVTPSGTSGTSSLQITTPTLAVTTPTLTRYFSEY